MKENKEETYHQDNANETNLQKDEISSSFIITKILLIIHMLVIFVLFLFFGFNHLVLFVATLTVTIRMYLGIVYNISNYFINGHFLFVMCFICHIIKIIFRFLLTYFVYKNKENISNLKDMDIIKTETILWIKGFDIKINGLWSLIIIIIFMIFWLILIILFQIQKKSFKNNIDEREKEQYMNLINQYYQTNPFNEVNNNNNDNNEQNNNVNINNNTN